LIIGLIFIIPVAVAASAGRGVQSAVLSQNRILINGVLVDSAVYPPVNVLMDGETKTRTYVPVEIFGLIGYGVSYNDAGSEIRLNVLPTPTPAPALSPAQQRAADNIKNSQTELKGGETYTFYRDGRPVYSITVRLSELEKDANTRVVTTDGRRVLVLEYEYENFNFTVRELLFSSFKFIGVNDKSFTVAPSSSLNVFFRNDFENGRTQQTNRFALRSTNGTRCPVGAKSGGTLIYITDDTKTLRISCQYSTIDGLRNGVTWDFDLR
jgi:hypothetical protein